MKVPTLFVSMFIMASLIVSCANPAASTTPPAPAPTTSIKPGDTLAGTIFEIAKDETAEPSIFNPCSPFITDSDPSIIVRTCSVPQMAYLFIGYGDFADSTEELDSEWNNEAWELYFDGNPVDLASFGYFDSPLGTSILRSWKIAVENLTPGEHKLRYVIRTLDESREPTDVTWDFAFGNTPPLATSSTEDKTYPVLSSSAATGQNPYTSEESKLNFLLYLPDEYGLETQQKWPLILYLHGLGERGNNLDYLITSGLPKRLQGDADFPFIVVSPQGHGEYEFWSKEEMVTSLFTLLDEIQANFSVDPKRIFLTGVSAGGEGTWNIGLRYPDRFAGLVPVMGYYGYPFEVPSTICDLKDVPIWAFHGAKDELVPLDAEEGLVNALKACGGNSQLTIFPNGNHGIEDEAYATPDLYEWMLSQSLK